MKTAIKIIAVLFVLIIALVVGLIFFGLGQIDKIAKNAVEYGGTYAMGVETTVDSVDVAVTKGTVEMGTLNIANPDGFDTSHFFQLANATASFDLESIGADTYIVPSIHLTGIDVILDKGNDPSNYNQILENLARFESGEAEPADKAKAGKNLIIKSLILEDINIHIANMPGVSLLAGDVAINIPQIELQNIGEKESMNAGDIFNLVIKTVLAAAVEAGGGIIPGDILGELGNGLAGLSSLSDMGIDAISDLNLDEALGGIADQAGEQLEKATEDVQKAVDDVADDLEDAVEDTANKLKGIFGGGKKDEP
ncbi:MAG: hypothetical protein JKX70_10345 [Phycisphaerales bacterium]|nr:hypothetical protein [Phycisphaerales bacterium]